MGTFDIARKVIDKRINKGKEFSLNEVQDEILNRGGILRVAPAVTVQDYLKNLEEKAVLKYNPYDNNYIAFNGKLEMLLKEKYDASLDKN